MFTKPETLSPESFELADLFSFEPVKNSRGKRTFPAKPRFARGLNINTTQHTQETNAYYFDL